jgi:hypothetical protein
MLSGNESNEVILNESETKAFEIGFLMLANLQCNRAAKNESMPVLPVSQKPAKTTKATLHTMLDSFRPLKPDCRIQS